jgi:hypothetical protein
MPARRASCPGRPTRVLAVTIVAAVVAVAARAKADQFALGTPYEARSALAALVTPSLGGAPVRHTTGLHQGGLTSLLRWPFPRAQSES